ncbi:hypothetical protein L7F22_033226 [Adiantum nelumboides]|nr:hypothetical protein [Adiantum nelumboides]
MGLDEHGNPLPGNEESHKALAEAMKRLTSSQSVSLYSNSSSASTSSSSTPASAAAASSLYQNGVGAGGANRANMGYERDYHDRTNRSGTPPLKRFQCTMCERAFARAYNLHTHMATHDPDPNRSKPFPCPYPSCKADGGRSFSRKHDLQRHVASTHENEPEPNIEAATPAELGALGRNLNGLPPQGGLASLGLGTPAGSSAATSVAVALSAATPSSGTSAAAQRSTAAGDTTSVATTRAPTPPTPRHGLWLAHPTLGHPRRPLRRELAQHLWAPAVDPAEHRRRACEPQLLPRGPAAAAQHPPGDDCRHCECGPLSFSAEEEEDLTFLLQNGRAFGGGCELALACDFRFMVDTPAEGIPGEARGSGLGQPEITLGLIPGGGGTQMLARMLGPAKALEICLEKTLLTAEEARDLGLVNALYSRKELMPKTFEFAERMARRAPAAVAAIKDSVYEGASRPIMQGMRRENGNFGSWYRNGARGAPRHEKVPRAAGRHPGDDTLQKFQPLQDGTFSEFRPNSAYLEKQWSRVTPRTPRQPVEELVQIRETARTRIKERAKERAKAAKAK